MNAKTPDLPPEPGSVPDLDHGLPGDPEPLPEVEVEHRADLDTHDFYSDED